MEARTPRQPTLQQLSLREKAAQLVMPRIGGEYLAAGTAAHERLRDWVEELRVGGVIIGMAPPFEAAAKLNMLQASAATPLLVAADMEHGAGRVLDGGIILPYGFENGGATRFPPLMGIGASGDEAVAEELGRVTAVEARAAGVHVVFAPVADVNSNPANPIINVRSYGAEPAFVGRMAAAHVRGLQAHGVLAVAKHFPGHGDTAVDSHVALPQVAADRTRLDALELVPFRAVIAAGVAGIMAGHVAYPHLTGDLTPATLSPLLLDSLLRRELGFAGLVFTDALDMGAIVHDLSVAEVAVRAVAAGADVLLQPPAAAVGDVIAAIVAAVDDGRLAADRVEEAAQRVLRAKQRLGLHDGARVDLDALPYRVAVPPHLAAAAAAARAAITLVRDDGRIVPIAADRVLCVLYADAPDAFVGRDLQAGLEAALPEVRTVRLDARSDAAQLAEVAVAGRSADVVIMAAMTRVVPGGGRLAVAEPVADALRTLSAERPAILVSFGSPYLLDQFPAVGAYMLAWAPWEPMQRAAAAALTGRAAVTGRLPIPLPPHHALGDGLRPGAEVAP
jgi:beta-N-acetylhexosaminidase